MYFIQSQQRNSFSRAETMDGQNSYRGKYVSLGRFMSITEGAIVITHRLSSVEPRELLQPSSVVDICLIFLCFRGNNVCVRDTVLPLAYIRRLSAHDMSNKQ